MVRSEKRSKSQDWLGLLSFGFFVALLGIIWAVTPNIIEEIRLFFNPENWNLGKLTGNVAFPEPKNGSLILYTAAMQFCLVFGTFHIPLLVSRFVFHEASEKMSGTFSGMVFWLTLGFFFSMLANGTITWFGFLAGLVICIGLSIISSSLFKLLRKD